MIEKLISADKLLEAGRNTSEFQQHIADEYDLECLIVGMPAVDAVEVIRCEKCRYTENDGCGEIYCQKWDRWEMPKDFFCKFGERREENAVD